MKLDRNRVMHLLEYAILLPGAGILIGGLFGIFGYYFSGFLHSNNAQRKLFFIALVVFGAICGIIGAIDFICRTVKIYNILDNEKKPEEIKNKTVK
jgi:hypothetical protein